MNMEELWYSNGPKDIFEEHDTIVEKITTSKETEDSQTQGQGPGI